MYAASILEGGQQLEILKYWLFLTDSPARLCTGWLAMASWWSIYSIKLVSLADCYCFWWLSELKRSYRKWPQCRLNTRVCQNCGHGTGDSIEKRKYSSRIWKLLNDSEVAHIFTDEDVKFQDVSVFSLSQSYMVMKLSTQIHAETLHFLISCLIPPSIPEDPLT